MFDFFANLYNQMEQLLCARGYSDQIAGLASSTYLLTGCLAAVPVSIIISKGSKRIQISKMLLVAGVASCGGLAYLLTIPGNPEMIITFCVLSGTLTIR